MNVTLLDKRGRQQMKKVRYKWNHVDLFEILCLGPTLLECYGLTLRNFLF